jgi:hypothetical protein
VTARFLFEHSLEMRISCGRERELRSVLQYAQGSRSFTRRANVNAKETHIDPDRVIRNVYILEDQ